MGFSADWLALREPADLAARDADLLRRAAALARAGSAAPPVIVDLGCGTGTTRRAFGATLEDAVWRVVDADANLLALARGEAHQTDLNRIDDLPLQGAGLVTASALLDLVSIDWLDRLIARLKDMRLPFYAALTYDGEMDWTKRHAGDAAVTRAFNQHQRGDKGFGPALGPQAAEAAAARLRAAGFRVTEAASPWRLGPDRAELQRELLAGIAAAAAEAGAEGCDDWLRARLASLQEGVCRIGHRDLLALPPGQGNEEGVA